MSIASTPFLFLFLPIVIGIYFLLPQSKNLLFRNLFLLGISLFFYAWGEPVLVLLLAGMIILTWLFGKMADGRGGTKIGNLAVVLTVIMNVGVLLFTAAPRNTLLPLGLSFFAFHSISYVVDIYRKQCPAAPKLLDAALYLSIFFKMQQGPVIAYHDFEPQIRCRRTTPDDFSGGIWRFAVGFCKKMMVANPLAAITKWIFASDLSALSLSDAWIGCGVFLVEIYFDFSGYSDMAIALGRIFGFKLPENFNYPYLSTSIGEYWRRWHITLCAWFRDYLYYPIVLGPSVSFRKFLLRHHVGEETAKTMQNIFVPTTVWLVTALWHGTNWNYTIWGLVNSSAMIAEVHFLPLKNKRVDTLIRWIYVMLILLFSVPLMGTASLPQAVLYFKAMLAGSGFYAPSAPVRYYLNIYWLLLCVGTAGSLMFFPWLKKQLFAKFAPPFQRFWQWGEALLLCAAVVISLGLLFRTGTITFMYQQ